MSSKILSETPNIKHHEPATPVNFDEFEKVVRSRRSVRVFKKTEIPDSVLQKIMDLTLLAPNTSNLQTWKFICVKNSEVKAKLAEACMSQNAAKTADVLVVCVAQPYKWKQNSKQMIELLKANPQTPKMALDYYGKLIPIMYTLDPLGILTLLKTLLIPLIGIFKTVPRGPYGYRQIREWSVKSCALACENLMLSFRAAGFDSCPMEGFDEARVKKAVGLSCCDHVVMVVGAGERAETGVYGPQIRFAREQFLEFI